MSECFLTEEFIHVLLGLAPWTAETNAPPWIPIKLKSGSRRQTSKRLISSGLRLPQKGLIADGGGMFVARDLSFAFGVKDQKRDGSKVHLRVTDIRSFADDCDGFHYSGRGRLGSD